MNAMVQKPFCKLLNYMFKWIVSKVLIVCGVLFVYMWVTALAVPTGSSSASDFSGILIMTQTLRVFWLAIVTVAVIITADGYTRFVKTHGTNTLMMLPLPRRNVFYAMSIVGIAAVLMIWAAQLLAIVSVYPVAVRNASAEFSKYLTITKMSELPFELLRVNGFFVAAMNNSILRMLLPQTWIEAVSSILLILGLGMLPSFCIFGAKNKIRFVWLSFILLGSVLVVESRNYNFWYRWNRMDGLVLYFAGIFAMTVSEVYMMVMGTLRLNKSANSK